MKRKDLLKYEGYSCRVTFSLKSKKTALGIEQSRTGHVKAVGIGILLLWPLDSEDGKEEMSIPLKDITAMDKL